MTDQPSEPGWLQPWWGAAGQSLRTRDIKIRWHDSGTWSANATHRGRRSATRPLRRSRPPAPKSADRPTTPRTSPEIEHVFDTLAEVTDVPRRAARRPRSLTPEQITDSSVTNAGDPLRVTAWVIWEDGVEERIVGHAIAWTARAVQIRFGVPPHQHETWVWAGAVARQ